jgi:hypothetical protein
MSYRQHLKMPEELERLYEGLKLTLEKYAIEADNELVAAEQGVELCERILEVLRLKVRDEGFGKDEEEIHFFKYFKPAFYSQLLFHKELYTLEFCRPRGGSKEVRRYFIGNLRVVQERMSEQDTLHRYMRSGRRDLDQQFFLRFWLKDGFPPDIELMECNPVFQTLKDVQVAEILRDDMLVEYIERELNNASVPQGTFDQGMPGLRKLKWTGKIKWLVQLSYGLAKSGVVGNASVVDIARALGHIFNTDLKNLYRANMEDRISKDPGDGIKFILDAYLKDTDDKDLNPRYR